MVMLENKIIRVVILIELSSGKQSCNSVQMNEQGVALL